MTMFSTIEPCKSLDSTPFDPDPDSIYQYMVTIADHLFRNNLDSRLIVGLNYLKKTCFQPSNRVRVQTQRPLTNERGGFASFTQIIMKICSTLPHLNTTERLPHILLTCNVIISCDLFVAYNIT